MAHSIKLLKELRNMKKLTQREVAEKIGVTTTHYNQVELGKRRPSISSASKIADVYGLEIYEVLEMFY